MRQSKTERELIREFDRELFSYTGQIAGLLPGIFSFILLFLMAMPMQEILDKGGMTYTVLLYPMLVSAFVLQPYLYTTDTLERRGRSDNTYGKLRYLPVSRRQYETVRMGYVFRYVRKLAPAGVAIQCVSAWLMPGDISFWNALYAAAVLLATPMTAGWLILLADRRRT